MRLTLAHTGHQLYRERIRDGVKPERIKPALCGVARIFFGEEHGVLRSDKTGPVSGKKPQTQAGEVFAVLVQGDEGDAMTAGKSSEVGIHPNFRRGGG